MTHIYIHTHSCTHAHTLTHAYKKEREREKKRKYRPSGNGTFIGMCLEFGHSELEMNMKGHLESTSPGWVVTSLVVVPGAADPWGLPLWFMVGFQLKVSSRNDVIVPV